MTSRMITRVHEDSNFQTVGICEGRKVQYTFATFSWYFVDTGEYITGPITVLMVGD